MAINTAAIFSSLGNPDSLLPLAIKDTMGSAGMTAGSFVTGKEEGVDRFIDEVGTEFIWLGGIPFFKWLYDNTLFKAFGFDSKYDPRNLKNKDIYEKTKEFAPNDKIKQEIEKIGKKQKSFKGNAYAKFFCSTLLTVASYLSLTKLKQHYTEKQIRKNLINEYQQAQKSKNSSPEKNNSQQNAQNPNFKGIGSAVEYFAFSPVKNMYILEGAITTSRLKESRTPQEFIGYAIKEGMALTFLYIAGPQIQKAAEKYIAKHYQKNISLDSRIIEGNGLKEVFDNGSVKNDLKAFKAADISDEALYEFVHKNPENAVVKAAKTADIIKMYKEPKKWYKIFEKSKTTDKIDTRKYIDLKKLRGVKENMENLYTQYSDFLAKGQNSEAFFNSLKKLKRGSIIANIATCVFALGILTPGIMLWKRLKCADDAEFQTKKEIRQQLINEGIIA